VQQALRQRLYSADRIAGANAGRKSQASYKENTCGCDARRLTLAGDKELSCPEQDVNPEGNSPAHRRLIDEIGN
jgi:hypothetical protein